MLVKIISEVAAFIAFGTFLDQIFIGKAQRERISLYLSGAVGDKLLNERFHDFLKITHSIVFDRFFSGRFSSKSFLMHVFVVSFFSFSITALLQVYFFGSELQDVNFDFLQISLIFLFIFANFLFDYFTIIQTKIFIEAALSARNLLKSAILIISDLIVTMNTFILFYAFFVLLVVQYFSWPSVEMNYIKQKKFDGNVSEVSVIPDYLKDFNRDDIFSRIKFTGSVAGLLVPKEDQVSDVFVFF